MSKSADRGALLFELFIALMILSIGIVSILNVFGATLLAGQKNVERNQAKKEVEQLLFSWAVDPFNATFLGGGTITFSLDNGSEKSNHWCEIHSDNLLFVDTSSGDTNPDAASKPSPYYQVNLRLTKDNGSQIFDFETVFMKVKKLDGQ